MGTILRRRRFLQAAGALGVGAAAGTLRLPALPAAEFAKGAPNAEKLGWRLSCCGYTFNQYSFSEAVDRIASLGVKYLEAFTWQALGNDHPGVQTNESMPAAALKAMKQKAADAGVKVLSCYMSEMPNKEDVCRKKFDWGKDLGLETIVAEPPLDAFDLLEKLCDEYQINLAIHNHPKPSSIYWDPHTVVKVTKGRSKRLGACADTGHWCRSGLSPIASCKLLEGRLVSFHLKDVAEFGKVNAEEVPWGKGQGRIGGVLAELVRQKAKVVLGIEYERGGYETRPEIAQSLAFLDKVAAKLAS
jgi:sugar phosphate isomerase/epimerase